MTTPDNRMTAMDAAFLYLERAGQRLHVASVVMIDGALDFERFVRDIDSKLHIIPRYKQRAAMVPFGLGHPTWEPDPQFDIRNHIIRHRLRGAGDEHQLVELASRLFAQELDLRRPLWEVHVVDNFREHHTALVVKVHHSMIDGISGVQLMGVMFDPTPNPAPPPPPTELDLAPPPPLPTPAVRVWRALQENAASRFDTARGLFDRLRRDPAGLVTEVTDLLGSADELWRYLLMPVPETPWNGHVSILRRVEWTTLSLHEVKAVKNRLGGTVNDVVLATISGALRAYLESRGVNPDRVELRAACPVSTRGAGEHLKLGNRVSAMMAPLPVGILDPAERYRQVRVAMTRLKDKGESRHIERMLDLLAGVPPIVQRNFAWVQTSSMPVNTICTNVPGPPVSLYVQGRRIERVVPVVPLTQGIGLAFAIMSYADTLTIGMPCDPALVPDAERLPGLLQEAFAELARIAGIERAGDRPVLVRPERLRRVESSTTRVA